MKRKVLFVLLSMGLTVVTHAQQGNGNSSAAGQNPPPPPGLEGRQQLPPGLNRRDTLPPGLEGRVETGQATNQLIPYGTNRWGFGTNNLGQFGTNQWNRFGTNIAGWGTNAYRHLSNAWTSLSNRFGSTNLSPTGNRTNRVYSTNSFSLTNSSAVWMRDQAVTPTDQRLLVQIHQVIRPMFNTVNQNQAFLPVHFIARQGVVTLVGNVSNQELKQRVVTLVREVPGVVQVVDQLQVNAVENTTVGSAQSAPSAASAVTQDQAFTATDQNLIVQLRQEIVPVIGNSEPWTPVHFISREGVVTLVGVVPNEQQRQQIFELVQRTPGVVQVINQIQVNVSAQTGTDGAALAAGATNRMQPNNALGGIFGRTNAMGLGTNLFPTGRTNSRVYQNEQNLPPGLSNRETLPPGLEKRDQLPPGLEKRDQLPPGPQQ